MNAIKKLAIKVFYLLLLPLVPYWYMLTMWLTKKTKSPVKLHKDPKSIASTLKWGRTWVADPLGGVLDNLYHPTKVQDNLNKGKSVGDCDDHAVYWCTALLKSGLAKRAWLSFYQYERADGVVNGHVVCVYEAPLGGYYWVDYGLPEKIERRNEWVNLMVKRKTRRVLGAAEIEITKLGEEDTPILGKAVKLFG